MTMPTSIRPRAVAAKSGVFAATGLLILAIGGCSGDDDQQSGESPSAAPTSSAPTSPASTLTPSPTATTATERPRKPASPSPSATASSSEQTQALLRAGQLGVRQVSGSTLYSIEGENDGNTWEVEVVTSNGTKYEMYISHDGHTVVHKPKKDGRAAKYSDRVKAAKLDYRAAVDVIAATVPNARVKELNLDHERGTVVWEADVVTASGTARSLEIDAASGKVLQNKVDT